MGRPTILRTCPLKRTGRILKVVRFADGTDTRPAAVRRRKAALDRILAKPKVCRATAEQLARVLRRVIAAQAFQRPRDAFVRKRRRAAIEAWQSVIAAKSSGSWPVVAEHVDGINDPDPDPIVESTTEASNDCTLTHDTFTTLTLGSESTADATVSGFFS